MGFYMWMRWLTGEKWLKIERALLVLGKFQQFTVRRHFALLIDNTSTTRKRVCRDATHSLARALAPRACRANESDAVPLSTAATADDRRIQRSTWGLE